MPKTIAIKWFGCVKMTTHNHFKNLNTSLRIGALIFNINQKNYVNVNLLKMYFSFIDMATNIGLEQPHQDMY
jgi:hypothetical protein